MRDNMPECRFCITRPLHVGKGRETHLWWRRWLHKVRGGRCLHPLLHHPRPCARRSPSSRVASLHISIWSQKMQQQQWDFTSSLPLQFRSYPLFCYNIRKEDEEKWPSTGEVGRRVTKLERKIPPPLALHLIQRMGSSSGQRFRMEGNTASISEP